MSARSYEGMYFENPQVQAEFERLVQQVKDAEQARVPIAQQHAKAERDFDSGTLSSAEFRTIDAAYISANNKIAAAQRAVDAFLNQNRNYHTR